MTWIDRILDAAIRAPSAGNAQNWAFVVVRDPGQRRRLGDIYRRASEIAAGVYRAVGCPPHLTEAQFERMLTSGAWLWEHMGEAPVLMVPCQHDRPLPPPGSLPDWLEARRAEETAYRERGRGASIYPAVQNIVLACRALGLGTTITTNHLRLEPEFKAVRELPAEVSTCALMPIGFPVGEFREVVRRASAEAIRLGDGISP
jgi:nitroreductase